MHRLFRADYRCLSRVATKRRVFSNAMIYFSQAGARSAATPPPRYANMPLAASADAVRSRARGFDINRNSRAATRPFPPSDAMMIEDATRYYDAKDNA